MDLIAQSESMSVPKDVIVFVHVIYNFRVSLTRYWVILNSASLYCQLKF